MEIKEVQGGICAPKGFTAWGTHCGIRSTKPKNDVMMFLSEEIAAAAGVYTTNKVYGAPITVTRDHIKDGKAQAVICNSGIANTCAPGGVDIAIETCELVGEELEIDPHDVIVASTGVIGEILSIEPFKKGIPELAANLSADGSDEAAKAIMTTDTVKKEYAVSFEIGGKTCTIGCIAKGSGMIHPDMATMLAFITSDVNITADMLEQALKEDIKYSFNQISVDGDMSTNDMAVIMANGMAGNDEINKAGAEFDAFCEALACVTKWTAEHLAADGEGAGKSIECHVVGAPDDDAARKISKSVIASNLLKAAIFGEDANWGRVLCAIGYADCEFPADDIAVKMSSENGSVTVCKKSAYAEYSEEEAAKILAADKIIIDVDINAGDGKATAWGCDLTYEYVKINGDYRS